MEPVTHFLTGACLSRAGFNRKAAYSTLAMTLAAEMPDLDVLWSSRGPLASFQHHRGITHTLIGLPADALIIVGAVWLIHRSRLVRGKATVAPVRWGRLYGFCLIALLSHLLLDWTNNYGIRPFFPFNPHWYAGSFVFIFEPLLFGALLLALVAPWLFGLISSEVGTKREVFRGRGWAIFALVFMVGLWSLRAVEHTLAEKVVSTQPLSNADGSTAPILRTFASPVPINPLEWHLVVETENFSQLMTIDTLLNTVSTDVQSDRFYKSPDTRQKLAAKQGPVGRAFLDWSSFPLVQSVPDPIDRDLTIVTFRDLRFMYDTAFFHGRQSTPMSMAVYVDREGHIVRQVVGDREQPYEQP